MGNLLLIFVSLNVFTLNTVVWEMATAMYHIERSFNESMINTKKLIAENIAVRVKFKNQELPRLSVFRMPMRFGNSLSSSYGHILAYNFLWVEPIDALYGRVRISDEIAEERKNKIFVSNLQVHIFSKQYKIFENERLFFSSVKKPLAICYLSNYKSLTRTGFTNPIPTAIREISLDEFSTLKLADEAEAFVIFTPDRVYIRTQKEEFFRGYGRLN